ncbi:MAG: M23 family metallopeptidase [Candidatus Aenigmarchaeota archaeon]|nr:M23 family metallopeptidase [Candidatus Aenigmarchaeota archaeon]
MAVTRNQYRRPLDASDILRISYDESPAHKGRLSNAVDFIVPEGTSVKAALDGTVVDVKDDSDVGGTDESFDSYGNYIEIRHANGEYSIYEHIRKNGSLVKAGDKVREGQIIGYSGSTGWIAHLGPHLHFDVHIYTGKGPEDYETLRILWKSS